MLAGYTNDSTSDKQAGHTLLEIPEGHIREMRQTWAVEDGNVGWERGLALDADEKRGTSPGSHHLPGVPGRLEAQSESPFLEAKCHMSWKPL